MAFYRRTPLEEMVSRLSSDDQFSLMQDAKRKIEMMESNLLSKFFNFALSEEQKMFLCKSGVDLSTNSYRSHSHPACKTLENYFLYSVLPNLISNIKLDNLFLFSIKKSKVKNLLPLISNLNDENKVEILNKIIEAKDVARYGFDPPPDSIKVKKKNLNIFIHDEIHHWSRESLIAFLRLHRPNNLFATLVFPVEACFGFTKSVNPCLYDFKVKGDYLHFYPDGVRSEGYRQSMRSKFLFKTCEINCNGDHYTLTFLRSIGAHHLILITRKHCDVKDKYREFGPYDMLDVGSLFKRKMKVPIQCVNYSRFKSTLTYILSLKKADQQSAVAKLRTLVKEDLDLDEVFLIRDLASRLIAGLGSNFQHGFAGIIKDWIKDHCPFTETLEKYGFVDDFDRHVMKIKPLTFEFTCDQDELEEMEDDADPAELIDSRWTGCKTVKSKDKISADFLLVDQKQKSQEYEMSDGDLMVLNSLYPDVDAEDVRRRRSTIWLKSEREDYLVLQGSNSVLSLTDKEHEDPGAVHNGNPSIHSSVITSVEELNEGQTDETEMGNMEKEADGSESERKMEKGKEKIDEGQETDNSGTFKPTFKKMFEDENVVTFESNIMINTDDLLSGCEKISRDGRECNFFATETLLYHHNQTSYLCKETPDPLIELADQMAMLAGVEKFNTCLIQRYKKGGKVGYHRDNEDCYDEDPIVTLNLNGAALFELDIGISSKLTDKDVIIMKSGLQNRARHRVESLDEGRVSLTFRVQRRHMSKASSWKFIERYGCLYKAIADGFNCPFTDIVEKCGDWPLVTCAKRGSDFKIVEEVAKKLECCIAVHQGMEVIKTESMARKVDLELKGNHYTFKSDKLKRPKMASRVAEITEPLFQVPTEDECLKFLRKQLNDAYPGALNEGKFSIDKGRCVKLAFSLLNGTTGVISDGHLKEGWRMLPGFGCEKDLKNFLNKGLDGNQMGSNVWSREFNCMGIFGFAGSGKSHGFQKILNEKLGDIGKVVLISPRVNLMKDWTNKVKGLTCKTFESALLSNLSGYEMVIIDEVTLFPNGYLDLLALKLSMTAKAILPTICLIGDPMQAMYHSEKDRALLSNVPMIESVFKDGINFISDSRRIPKATADRFGMHDLTGNPGSKLNGLVCSDLSSARRLAEQEGIKMDAMLVASQLEKNAHDTSFPVMTYGESQGLTFDFGLISISEETKVTSDNQIYVALTRFKKGFMFLLTLRGSDKKFKENLGTGLIGRFVRTKDCLGSYMRGMTDVKVNLVSLASNKGAGHDFEEKCEDDPWLKALLDAHSIEYMDDVVFDEVKVLDPIGKVHLPISHVENEFENIRSRESREFKSENVGWSNQFDDLGRYLKDTNKCNYVENFSSIYPRHRADDDLTFLAAVMKRLRFSRPEKNLRKFEMARTSGLVMLKEFLHHIKVPKRLDDIKLNEARLEFREVKMKKDKNTIGNHSGRSDPDWDIKRVFVFMKSQMCTKFEKRFVDAKAGQTLACFSHAVLNRFAPWCRYMEKVFTEACPPNFYIHQKKDFEQLNEFTKKYSRGGVCVESDYEAFDVSQDHLVLAFEVALMEHMGIPSDVVNDYIILKTHLGYKGGQFDVMRFTGEFCTFLFNTFCNMVFTFMRYEVRKGDPICFAGDDMCALVNLKVSNRYEKFLKGFTLKAKVQRTRNPMFCGWRLTPFGLFKEPVLVYERLRIAIEKGVLKDVIESYFLEFSFAYKLGHMLELVLDELQLNYQQRLARFFVKNKALLKGKSLELISDCEYLSDGNDEENCEGFRKDRFRGYSNCRVASQFALQ